jgi:hypothetical protein
MLFTVLRSIAIFVFAIAQPLASYAYTDAEIDQMIKALQQENQELRAELAQALDHANERKQESSNLLTEHLVPASSQTQAQAQAVVNAGKSQISSINQSIEQQQESFHVNGFLTTGAALADREVSDQNNSFSDDLSFDTDSIVGLQAKFKLSDRADITTQLVARSADDWDLSAEWAFVSYRFNEQMSVRAGRLRLPIYLFSESVEVGFSYPWVRPPSEVYSLPINNYEGVDFLYSRNFGDWVSKLQVFAGNSSNDAFQANELFGANITLSSGAWTFRASASDFAFDIDVSAFSPIEQSELVQDGGSYYNISGMYDDGEWLLLTELSNFDADRANIFRDSDAGYITIGKYMGDWMPHLTIAKTYTTNEPEPYTLFSIPVEIIPAPGAPPIIINVPISSETLEYTSTSYTLGLRYNLNANTSAKLEWSRYSQLEDTGGIWTNLRFAAESEGVDEIDIYSIVVDMVF